MSSPATASLLASRLRRIAVFALVFVVEAARATQPIPAFADVKAAARPSVAVLLARDGTPLAERRIDPHVRRLEWVALNSFSPALREALLAAEDKRFFEHSGVDWRAFVGALWHNLWYDRKRGASTLSMQLAGLLDPELALGRGGMPRRSLGQKWDQALAAQALEARWTKEQILEAYLNLAPFRGDLQGVHAAARALFGKSPAELGRAEALILAVLLRGPNARPEHEQHPSDESPVRDLRTEHPRRGTDGTDREIDRRDEHHLPVTPHDEQVMPHPDQRPSSWSSLRSMRWSRARS